MPQMTDELALELRKLIVGRQAADEHEEKIYSGIFALLDERADHLTAITELSGQVMAATETMAQVNTRLDILAAAVESSSAALREISARNDTPNAVQDMINAYFAAMAGMEPVANG